MSTTVPVREAPSLSVLSKSLLVMVRSYQAVRAGRPSPCRYWPSCSEYAHEAIERFGAARGVWLAARRLGRCRPWGGSGIDLVPDELVSGDRA